MPTDLPRKVVRFLRTLSVIFSFAVLMSLWITGSDHWKWYLPIALLCVAIENFFKEDRNLNDPCQTNTSPTPKR